MDFVSFDLAKKLKEKGFKEKVIKYYGKYENIFDCHPPLDMNDADYRCSAPTLSQVLKWLREDKNIHIEIRLFNCGYGFDILEIYPKNKIAWSGTLEYETFEQASVAGIEYVLDNLI